MPAFRGEIIRPPRVRRRPLGRHRPLHRAVAAGLHADAPGRIAGAALGAQRDDAADRLTAVQRALRTVRHLQAVARPEASPAKKYGVIRVRVVEPQAVDQEQRLVRVGPAQENRRTGAGCARGKQRGARHAAEGLGERGDLLPRQVGAGQHIDGAAHGLGGGRRARRRGNERLELVRRRLAANGGKRQEGAEDKQGPARKTRPWLGIHGFLQVELGKSRNPRPQKRPEPPPSPSFGDEVLRSGTGRLKAVRPFA